MVTQEDRELAMQAEIRALQLVISSILGFALSYEKDKEYSVKYIRDFLWTSATTLPINDIPKDKQKIFREIMIKSAVKVIDIAVKRI